MRHRDFDFCPACGGRMPPYMGATSRRDNATEICPPCGVIEAFQVVVCPNVLKKGGSGKA